MSVGISNGGVLPTTVPLHDYDNPPPEVDNGTSGSKRSSAENVLAEKHGRFSTVCVEEGKRPCTGIEDLSKNDIVRREVTIDEGSEKTRFLESSDRSEGDQESLSYMDLLSVVGGDNLLLYGEPSNLVTAFLKGFTVPGPRERAESKYAKKKVNLGVMLGVYLPTIQHILGVTMFIRLFWLVGIAGLLHTFFLLALCCACTLLTSISISALATNGEVKTGGAYFLISRNLGPEFGSAVGFLFYLANAVATSMYLVGGVEILLIYIFPDLIIGGKEVQTETGAMGMMTHNLRIYSTVLLIVEFSIVAMGVRFVQLLAPVSLLCVIVSILACYAGGVAKTFDNSGSQHICMYGERPLQAKIILPENASISSICDYCTYETMNKYFPYDCSNGTCSEAIRCINGFTGFTAKTFFSNLFPSYMSEGEYLPGRVANKRTDVFQDVDATFFQLLAVYFPAVTGILTGTNMSGDLKDSSKSIPVGTIAAQITTSLIYFLLALVCGAAIDGAVLRDKYGQSLYGGMVLAYLAWPSEWVILIGSFTSTFGAALQCLCSAPRLLQALAKDDVIPFLKPFAKVTKKNEPFNGLILSTVIAEAAILLGGMDDIAALVDFFFLMCYAFVNLTCALYSLMRMPNWRPRFRFYHWSLSILGAILCFFIMFSTHWFLAILCCILFGAVYKYVEWKGAKKEWGDGIRGLALSTAQYSIMKVEEKEPHPKNFRPQLLLLFSLINVEDMDDVRHARLIQLASQLKAGRGLSIIVSFIRGDPLNVRLRADANLVKKHVEEDMVECKLRGFSKTIIYGENQIAGSLSTLIQSIGLGGLRPNTVLLKWPIHGDYLSTDTMDSEYQTFTDKLLAATAMDMCVIVAKNIVNFPHMKQRLHRTMDVYWIVQDGGLCLLIAYLLSQHKVWRHCKIRVIAIAQENDNNVKIEKDLQDYVYRLRIDAQIMVIELSDPEISKVAFEQTLLMEERTRLAHEIRGGGGASDDTVPATTVTFADRFEVRKQIEKRGSMDDLLASGQETQETIRTDNPIKPNVDSYRSYARKSGRNLRRTMEMEWRKFRQLDRQKVQKMHTAVRLNEIILKHSSDSELVILNLPKPPINKQGLSDYVHYLEVLSENVKRIMFIRGTNKDKIVTTS
uniref:Amino acid permease n=1 Tax=Syphacia muris TaxID=451379 RepID=A0A0N5AVM1_9BILA